MDEFRFLQNFFDSIFEKCLPYLTNPEPLNGSQDAPQTLTLDNIEEI